MTNIETDRLKPYVPFACLIASIALLLYLGIPEVRPLTSTVDKAAGEKLPPLKKEKPSPPLVLTREPFMHLAGVLGKKAELEDVEEEAAPKRVAKAIPKPRFVVSGVFVWKGASWAYVDGKLLKEGQHFGGVTLHRVTRDQVILKTPQGMVRRKIAGLRVTGATTR